MNKISLILFILQIIAFFGGFVNGSIVDMFTSGLYGFFELIGFCLPAIIGVILLRRDRKKKNKKENE